MNKKGLAIGVPIAIVLIASKFASTRPDTLESVAETHGFAQRAKETISLFSDYTVPFISNEFLSTFIAGLIGLILLYAIYKCINIAVKRFVK
ncbi:MAG: PDGLE domain-containing protein [Elusimicrobiota bacterium]|jgi:cobalt/nickel transport protein|nr:PDGLE domain-containing protein [Elusimicrobiota bacterium]